MSPSLSSNTKETTKDVSLARLIWEMWTTLFPGRAPLPGTPSRCHTRRSTNGNKGNRT